MKRLAKLHQEQLRIYAEYQEGTLSSAEYILAITPLDEIITQIELSMILAVPPAWQKAF